MTGMTISDLLFCRGLGRTRGARRRGCSAWCELRVAKRCFGCEGWCADSEVLRTSFERSRVAHPFIRRALHGLPRRNFDHSVFMLHAQCSANHNGYLGERRPLPRLVPALGRTHMSNRNVAAAGVYATDIFVDDLRFVPGGLNALRCFDELWHIADDTGSAGRYATVCGEPRAALERGFHAGSVGT